MELYIKSENSFTNAELNTEITIKTEFPEEKQCLQIKKETQEEQPEQVDIKFEYIKLEPIVSEEVHVKDESPMLEDDDSLYICSNCNYQTSIKSRLQWHLKTHRSEPFQCTRCDCKCFKGDHLVSGRKRLWKCKFCEFETAIRYRLERHMVSHLDSKPFECSLCDYKTGYQDNLKTHVKKHSLGKLFKCRVCNYRTSVQYNFEMHAPTHEKAQESGTKLKVIRKSEVRRKKRLRGKEKSLKCPNCDFRTAYKQNLEKHAKVHASGKFFVCDKCSYRTRTLHNFEMHIPMHNASIKNEYCGDKRENDRQIEDLESPKTRESNVDLFTCEKCNYRTKYKHNIQRHNKKSNCINQFFQCGKCRYRTNVKKNFLMHLPTHEATSRPDSPPKKRAPKASTKYLRCDKCAYRTYVKWNFEMHLPTHQELASNDNIRVEKDAKPVSSKPSETVPSTLNVGTTDLGQGFVVVDSPMLNMNYYCQMQNLGVINYVNYR